MACGMWFGGCDVNGHVHDGCRKAKAMPPALQVPSLPWLAMVLRIKCDYLNKAMCGLPSGASMGS